MAFLVRIQKFLQRFRLPAPQGVTLILLELPSGVLLRILKGECKGFTDIVVVAGDRRLTLTALPEFVQTIRFMLSHDTYQFSDKAQVTGAVQISLHNPSFNLETGLQHGE